jgi:hypothetical protein
MYGVRASLKSVPAIKMIGDFYFWDNRLAKFRNGDEYEVFLKELKSVGVNKLVGTDFTVGHVVPRPLSIYNLYLNLNRIQMNYKAGVKSIFDANNSRMEMYEDVFSWVLPKTIPTVMFDLNHGLSREYLEIEKRDNENFIGRYGVKSAILQTTGTTIRPDAVYLLKLFKDYDVSYGCIPSNTTLMSKVKAVQGRKNRPPKEIKTIGKSKKIGVS